jgi:hypothetical protein
VNLQLRARQHPNAFSQPINDPLQVASVVPARVRSTMPAIGLDLDNLQQAGNLGLALAD